MVSFCNAFTATTVELVEIIQKLHQRKCLFVWFYLGFKPHSLQILIYVLATHLRQLQMKERSHQSNITAHFLGSSMTLVNNILI